VVWRDEWNRVKGSCIRWACTLTPPGKYGWTIVRQQWVGLPPGVVMQPVLMLLWAVLLLLLLLQLLFHCLLWQCWLADKEYLANKIPPSTISKVCFRRTWPSQLKKSRLIEMQLYVFYYYYYCCYYWTSWTLSNTHIWILCVLFNSLQDFSDKDPIFEEV